MKAQEIAQELQQKEVSQIVYVFDKGDNQISYKTYLYKFTNIYLISVNVSRRLFEFWLKLEKSKVEEVRFNIEMSVNVRRIYEDNIWHKNFNYAYAYMLINCY